MLVVKLCVPLYLSSVIILYTFRHLADTFIQSNVSITLTHNEPLGVQCPIQGHLIHVTSRNWESNHWPSKTALPAEAQLLSQ